MCCMFSRSSSLEDAGQRLGAGVELLVVGVDLTLAVDGVAVPAALGAAPPEAPVAAVAGLLPAGRLDQARAAPGADVQAGGLGRLGGRLCGLVWLMRPCLSNPRNCESIRTFSTENEETPLPGSRAQPIQRLIQSRRVAVTMVEMPKHRTSRARDRPDHRPGRLRAETPAGARPLPRPRDPRVQRLGQRRPRRRRRRRAASRPPRSSPRQRPPAKAAEDEPVAHDRG